MHVNSGSWINCRAGPWGGKATVWIIAESLCQTLFVFLCNFELVHGIDISYPQAAEKATAPHSSTRAWKISWMEEPVRLQSMGSLRVRHDWAIYFHFSLSCIGEGNGNPLQCSCLENPRDGGAWWAAVYGVAQSRTRLKWRSSSSDFQEIWYFLGSSKVKRNFGISSERRFIQFKKRQSKGVPGGLVIKNPSTSTGDTISIPGPVRCHMPESN